MYILAWEVASLVSADAPASIHTMYGINLFFRTAIVLLSAHVCSTCMHGELACCHAPAGPPTPPTTAAALRAAAVVGGVGGTEWLEMHTCSMAA